jgi:YHS domain-containing protein
MDGAIAGNTPVVTAAELGATRIVVLQTGYACSLSGPPRGAVARGMHALTLLISNQLERDLRLLEGRVDVHVTPHLCPLDVSPFNFDHSSELIERSALLTREWLESDGLGKRDPPDVVRHDHAAMQMRAPFAGGYDVVSYFQGSAIAGVAQFAVEHDGQLYLFASAANRDAFLADPTRYQPQYGGHCAWAMAQGKVAPGDPRFYGVTEDGRLFFNLNAAIQKAWEKEMSENIRRADQRWRARREAGSP